MGGTGGIITGQWAPSAFALFMVQVLLIVALSRVYSQVLKYLKQPAVVAEMLAGITLGPTVMGRIPHFSELLFPPQSVAIIGVISNFALIFFMFIVGLELDPVKLKADLKMAMWISGWGIVVPFIASCLLTILFDDPEFSQTSFIKLALFLTCAIGMSALPVLARILSERRMLATRLGGLSMSVAAVDDVIAWCMLAITLAIIRSTDNMSILWTILLILAELVFMIAVVGPLIRWLVSRDKGYTHLNADTFLILSLILIGCSYLAEIIGLSALIGAFQVGLLIPRTSNLSHHLSEKVEYFTVVILMPLFFTNSGLRTQFGLIDNGRAVGLCILIIVVATVAKMIGITVPGRAAGIPWRLSAVIGALMSCKGLVALIVVNYGVEYNIITPKFFAILVLMVLVTTIQTVPLMQCIDPPSRSAKTAIETIEWEEREAAKKAAKEAAKLAAAAAPTNGGEASALAPGAAAEVDRVKTLDVEAADGGGGGGGGEADTIQVRAMMSSSGAHDVIVARHQRTQTAGMEATAAGTGSALPPGRWGFFRRFQRRAASATSHASGPVADVDVAVDLYEDALAAAATGAGVVPALPMARHMSDAGMEEAADEVITSESTHIRVPRASMARSDFVNVLRLGRASTHPTTGGVPALRIMVALGETAPAPGLMTCANLFPTSTGMLQADGTPARTRLTLAWLLDSVDMPSSYMNMTDSVADIRDSTLVFALDRCHHRDMARVSTFPTEHHVRDALEEAYRRDIQYIITSSRFLRNSNVLAPSREDIDAMLRLAVTCAKPCPMAVLFDFGLSLSITRLLVPTSPEFPSSHSVRSMLELFDDSLSVVHLHAEPGALPSTTVERHVAESEAPRSVERPRRRSRTAASGQFSARAHADSGGDAPEEGIGHMESSKSAAGSRRSSAADEEESGMTKAPLTTAVSPLPAGAAEESSVVELPTVNTFSALLKGASPDELAAYRAAIESAQATRYLPFTHGPVSSNIPTIAEAANEDAEGVEGATPSSAAAAAASAAAAAAAAATAAPSTFFEAALEAELVAHGPHYYDLVVMGAATLPEDLDGAGSVSHVSMLVERLHNMLLVCLATKTPVLVVFSPSPAFNAGRE